MNKDSDEVVFTHEGHIKLPKQWRHWCSRNGFRVHGRKTGKNQYRWFYLKGHGHVWRVNCHGAFEMGDPHAEFDRWALCREIQRVPLPQSRRQFERGYKLMLRSVGAAHG